MHTFAYLHISVGGSSRLRPTDNDSELSVRRLTLVCRCGVSPRKNKRTISQINNEKSSRLRPRGLPSDSGGLGGQVRRA